jgi:MFS superfamily sulfate permease-like transporter
VREISEQGTEDYLKNTLMVTFISGLTRLLLGLFRLGFVVTFLSEPVMVNKNYKQ